MSEQKPQIIPVQYIPYCEEDEIDLKEIVKKILSYKKFILTFTLTITFLAGLYTFLKKPVYEIKADLKIGHINYNTNNNIQTIYLLNPHAISIYIKNTYDHSNNDKIKLPEVNANIIKNTKDLINITIHDISNEKALNTLQNIIKDLKEKEKVKINSFIKNINSQIKLLKQQQTAIEKQLQFLNQKLKKVSDPNIYQTILSTIGEYQDKILKIKLQINNLKEKISPLNITQTSIVGKIIKHDYPVKPKKKLIIIVAFITGFILSIFLVFFIEFIKGLKEEN